VLATSQDTTLPQERGFKMAMMTWQSLSISPRLYQSAAAGQSATSMPSPESRADPRLNIASGKPASAPFVNHSKASSFACLALAAQIEIES
jgi:hypothetical protein